MPEQIIGQITSIIGMILTIISFQMKTRNQIILLQTAGSAFYLVSFLFLGKWAPVCLNVVFLFRNFLCYFRKDKAWAQSIVWLYVLLAAVIAAGTLGFHSWWDLFPIIGSVFGTIAMYMKNENMLRLLKLGDSPCWLIYNFTVPSVGGVIGEVFNITSIIVGLIRYKKDGLAVKEA